MATEGTLGHEIWSTDGTSAGTAVLKDISEVGAPGDGPMISSSGIMGGTLFFSARTSAAGDELWKTDGTAAGTVLVKDIFPGANSSGAWEFHALNGQMFFKANDGLAGFELWKTDGTAAGTVLVKDVFPGASGGVQTILGTLNGVLYFVANDGVTGTELWRSDGTAAGTYLFKDITPGAASSSWANLGIAVGDKLFFCVYTNTYGFELWQTDGTADGTKITKDIYPGTEGGGPDFLMPLNGRLVFPATNPTSGRELWVSDGTEAGTQLLRDTWSGVPGSSPANFYRAGTKLLFTANDGVNGEEIWVTDGTVAGTVLVQNLTPGSAGTSVTGFAAYGTTTFASIMDETTGRELWSTSLAILPADLLEFTVGARGDHSVLNWRTTNEQRLRFFGVERSTDGRNYSELRQVMARGGGGYTFVDSAWSSLIAPVTYYRLKLVDDDGQFRYSPVRLLRKEAASWTFSLFPNPVVASVQVRFLLDEPRQITYRITDAGQRLVSSGSMEGRRGDNLLNLSLNGKPAGIYYFTLNDGKSSATRLVMKQ